MKRSKTVGDLVGLGHYEKRKESWARKRETGSSLLGFPPPPPPPFVGKSMSSGYLGTSAVRPFSFAPLPKAQILPPKRYTGWGLAKKGMQALRPGTTPPSWQAGGGGGGGATAAESSVGRENTVTPPMPAPAPAPAPASAFPLPQHTLARQLPQQQQQESGENNNKTLMTAVFSSLATLHIDNTSPHPTISNGSSSNSSSCESLSSAATATTTATSTTSSSSSSSSPPSSCSSFRKRKSDLDIALVLQQERENEEEKSGGYYYEGTPAWCLFVDPAECPPLHEEPEGEGHEIDDEEDEGLFFEVEDEEEVEEEEIKRPAYAMTRFPPLPPPSCVASSLLLPPAPRAAGGIGADDYLLRMSLQAKKTLGLVVKAEGVEEKERVEMEEEEAKKERGKSVLVANTTAAVVVPTNCA